MWWENNKLKLLSMEEDVALFEVLFRNITAETDSASENGTDSGQGVRWSLSPRLPEYTAGVLLHAGYWCLVICTSEPAATMHYHILTIHSEFYGLFLFDATVPQWARASSLTRFLHHTQQHTTVGRTPLDEWSACRRDPYLTTHATLTTDKHPCPRWDLNPQSQQARGRRPTS